MRNLTTKNRKPFLATLILVWLILPQAQALAEWQPPIGIPKPEFGIEETYRMYDEPANRSSELTYTQNLEGGFYTHYVDNTHPSATDNSNPYGTTSKPRKTIPSSLPAGSVVEVHGGPYESQAIIRAAGSLDLPIFVKGVDTPEFRGRVYLVGEYMIFEDFYFNNDGYVMVRYPGENTYTFHHISIRNNELEGDGTTSGHTAIFVGRNGSTINETTHHIVIYNNHLHHRGDYTYEGENDISGVAIAINSHYIWMVDNHIHHNGGDSLITGHQAEYTISHVYVGRNEMHADGENAIDIKDATDIIVSQNTMYDYLIVPSSSGPITVTHSSDSPDYLGARRIWFIANEMYNSENATAVNAVRSSREGADIYFIGNIIHDVKGGAFSSSRDIENVGFVGNTMYNVDLGIFVFDYEKSGNTVTIQNNIFGNLSNPEGTHIKFESLAYPENIIVSNNLFQEPMKVNTASVNYIEADPLFVDELNNDFHLQSISPAIDNGTSSDVYQKFYDLYGIDIRKDMGASSRPQGSDWDIGAYEYLPLSYEGFGAVTNGALDAPGGYEVYHVTTTDSGINTSGSLENALACHGAGIAAYHIIFDVAGTIQLTDNHLIKRPYLTIDGSTAPYPGITIDTRLKDADGNVVSSYDFSIEARTSRGPVHDVIINNLRFIGPGAAFSKDLLAIDGTAEPVSRVIIDNCTIDAAGDGICEIYGNVNDVTVSWNLITGTVVTQHISGATTKRERISVHHNVYAKNNERQIKVANQNEMIDFVNNVIYGWGWIESGGTGLRIGPNVNVPNEDYPTMNVENNYYKYVAPYGAAYMAIYRENPTGKIYFNGNVFPEEEEDNYSTSARHVIPEYAEVTKYDANTLGDTVVPFAGTHYPTQEEQDLLDEISLAIGGEDAPFLYGDVSGNGTISATDAAMAARHAVGLISLTPEQTTAADVTGNGAVSATDASWIARKAVDPDIVFPVEE